MSRVLALLLVAAAGCGGSPASALPAADTYLTLTWHADPARSIQVNVVTDYPGELVVECAAAGAEPRTARVFRPAVPLVGDERYRVHHFRLEGLEPATEYRIDVRSLAGSAIAARRRFRTLPIDDRPLRFAVGGDMGTGDVADEMVRRIASREPDAVWIGGDIAYANGREKNADRWLRWLGFIREGLITPEGLTPPLVLAIGNHELNKRRAGSASEDADPRALAPFYFSLFEQAGDSTYFRRPLGSNAVLYALDSGHLAAHGDAQAAWLAEHLEQDREVPWRFALYHVPLYPSHRSWEDEDSAAGRASWEPLFSRFRLTAAFEHHDHTHKRTKRIADGAPSPTGVLYLGDGGLGQKPRSLTEDKPWYIETWSSLRHFWLVDVRRDGVTYRAIDRHGEVFDAYPPSVGASAASGETRSDLSTPPSLRSSTVTPASGSSVTRAIPPSPGE